MAFLSVQRQHQKTLGKWGGCVKYSYATETKNTLEGDHLCCKNLS